MLSNVLSIEEMKRIEKLGIKTDNASMFWTRRIFEDGHEGGWFLSIINMSEHLFSMRFDVVPTFTLQNILDVLPFRIVSNTLSISKRDETYVVSYMNDYTHSFLESFENESALKAAYNMLCWCAHNGHIK